MSGPAAFAAVLFGGPTPAGLRSWNGSPPTRRFAVYRNNVVVSLVEALADSFPVCHELVGDEFFRAMAREYVVAEPPRSPILAHYGGSFPDFIHGFPPAAPVPYLADVARLEYGRIVAFHAADAPALDPAALRPLLGDPARLAGLRFRLHPGLSVHASPYAIVSLWAAHQGIGELSAVVPDAPECALILRPGLEVEVIALDAADATFVAAVHKGSTLAEAVVAASRPGADFDPAPALRLLLEKGTIVGFAETEENHG